MGTTPGKPPTLWAPRESGALVEREGELELVERLLGEAAEGSGSLLVLDGPAGIGKSRLLAAAQERAEARGFQLLRARGGELERDFSHGVVRQLYEARLAACDEDERAALLAGAARLAAPLFEFADTGEARSDDTEVAFATLHGLFWLTANITERAPTLVSVDDLQWCDRPSLRFLSYLARRLDGLPLLVAVSLRPGEPDADVAVLAELESEPHATVVGPAPLSLEAVQRLLQRVFDSDPAPEFVRAVHLACGGNPLLFNELVRAVLGEGLQTSASAAASVRELGPETLARVVLRRLRRLGAAAEALARAVAILGDDCELAVAAALAVLDPQQAATAAAALARVEILRARGPLGFVHPVLRAAVYGDLSDAERSLAHERAAELLADRDAASQQVAVHLLQARPKGRASVVAALREAGRRASTEGAADTARTYLERALAEPPGAEQRADVLFELGVAELRSGMTASGHLEEADRLLQGQPRSAEAVLALASGLYAEGRQHDAADVLRERIDRLGPSDAAAAQRLEAQLIGWARYDARLYPMARERLARIDGAVSEDSFDGRFLLALAASELARAGDSPDRARELVHRALAAGPLLSDESWQAYAVALAVLVTLDDLDAAVRSYTGWLEEARTRGLAFTAARAAGFRALAMLRCGELAEAEADARTALDISRSLAGERGHPELLAHLSEALAERGKLAEAIATLDAGAGDEERPTFQAAQRLDVRARLRIAAGEAERGLADLLVVGERLEAFGVRNPSHSAWRSRAALVLHGLGDREEARRLAHEELELARRWSAPRPLGAALRAAGLIEPGADGLELLRMSVDVLGASPALLERAKSLTELGAALRRANQRAEARGLLHDGLDLAERCGAAPVAERAHAELLATGARPRRLVRTGVDSLTPSERRVAQMAADGQTNREIAQGLFVTPKTIEMHLSNAYRKLDIQARSQLTRAMAETA
jgi:DNA-binding CsgD family transcriptional regulator